MRTAFAQELTRLASEDERVVLLVGDIGNSLFNEFRERYPSRFFNCGIAEQNMVSMAAGMAAAGLRPVCFTIAPFLTARCFEQIKIDLGYHNVPVVLAGVGAGLCYANLGPTHQALDDIAILRTVPNVAILVPYDKTDARICLRHCLKLDGPSYLRLARDGEDDLLGKPRSPEYGEWRMLQSGDSRDAVVLACGNTAAKALIELIPRYDVVGCSTLTKLDQTTLWTMAGWKLVVTVEEHGIGGFGDIIGDWFAVHDPKRPLLRIRTPDEFLPSPMSPDAARDYCGLTPEKIATRIRDELARLR